MNNISIIFSGLGNSSLPAKLSADCVEFAQEDTFFHLAVAKNARIERLREYFGGKPIRKVFLSGNLAPFEFSQAPLGVEFLDKGFFGEANDEALLQKKAHLDGAIVIVNNNDVGKREFMPFYARLYELCDETIFVGWDWDNHHWLESSTFLAAHSDIYAPAHHENLYLLSRYNGLISGPVYCAAVQWSRQFLANALPGILLAQRSPEPLGKHVPYASFRFRNRVVATLNSHHASITFSDWGFHDRTAADRLQEWVGHKCHWIVPVLNDVPIRIFDALVTGGIPIVPESLRYLPPVNAIDRQSILFFGPMDVINPGNIVARANALFDEGGQDGLVARHRYALDHHHGDSRIRQMLGYVADAFDLDIPSE